MRDVALRMDGELDGGAEISDPQASPLLPLRVRGLSYRAGGRTLIDNLDVDLAGHGVTMVLGPNGAGKSLLLRLLHGLIVPSSGEISWGGVPLSRSIQERQALVFQKPVLLRRSVGENIDFVLRLRGQLMPERRDELLDRVGLLGLAKQPARLLSGGEQQRLSLARALATKPDVLLLDEPTASLDPASVQMIEAIVKDASRLGVRIVFVTHDIGQARRLADDVVFLHRGRVAEHSASQAFFKSPASEAARDFLSGRIVL